MNVPFRAKYTRLWIITSKVLFDKFVESSMVSQMHSKYAQQTRLSNLWKQIYIITDLCSIRRSAQIHRSLDQQLSANPSKILAVRLSQVISPFFLALGFWEVQSIKSQNFQITDCVLREYFQNSCSSYIFIRNLGTEIWETLSLQVCNFTCEIMNKYWNFAPKLRSNDIIGLTEEEEEVQFLRNQLTTVKNLDL